MEFTEFERGYWAGIVKIATIPGCFCCFAENHAKVKDSRFTEEFVRGFRSAMYYSANQGHSCRIKNDIKLLENE